MKKIIHSLLITFSLLLFLNSAFGQNVPGGESDGIAIAQPDPSGTLVRLALDNYPNPVINITTIRYTVPVTGRIVLKIYSTTGKEMATLHNGFQQRGSHSVKFDVSNISRGIYVCSLSYICNSKIVVISKKINVIR